IAMLIGSLALALGAVCVSALRARRRPALGEPARARASAEPAAPAADSSDASARASAAAPAAIPEEPARAGPLRDRLRGTREALAGRLRALLRGERVDAALLERVEALLFEADLGVKAVESLLAKARAQLRDGDAAALMHVLREAVLEKLRRVEPERDGAPLASPHVVLVLGVNGAGKTTFIGKLAARHRAAGRSVILGAGDTFRAAAIEQLQAWGERTECDVVVGAAGGDPSAVAFDTVKAAVARGIDVAIIDTAGRLQTKRPLMEELGKMVRVIGKGLADAPHEVLLVLDATTGQNALSQARLFSEVARVTGLVLTKLDGTAKGGVLVGLADEFGIPVQYVGIGEAAEDLRDFSAVEFVDAVFAADADPAPR
ncbi:MAG TPA: signal recognition particle-docking protein FtsY, partial [Myxococcota bacterium]|nr:signal recognition particle-docking protein FtsY [Myxococcota bacterium]